MPAWSADELLADARWVRRLAGSLVRDDAEADDLAQDTWLAAARAQPDGDRSLRPWLAQVLRNFVKMRHRSAAVRARELPEPEAAPSPAELLDRLQAQRLVARLVAELAEPYRTTLLLRYYEGLEPAEIARLQNIPAGTVRWRLKTALERLRAAMDRATGDRRRWSIALLPLGLPRRTVPLLKGILLMSRTVRIAIVILFLLGLGLLVTRHRASAPAPTPTVARAPAPPSRGGPSIRLAPVVVDRDSETAFEGVVLNWATGEGVAKAQLTFVAAGGAASVMTDDHGNFRFRPAQAGRQVLQVASAPGYLPFAPEWSGSGYSFVARPGERVRGIVLYLTPAIDYHGLVVDPAGKPVAGAQVTLLGAQSGLSALEPITGQFTSDAQGEFLFHARDDQLLEAHAPGFGAGRATLDGAAQVTHKLTIRLGPPGSGADWGSMSISGRVVDAAGAPRAGVLVRANHRTPAEPHPEAEATTDGKGAFELRGLDPGPHRLVTDDARADAPAGARDVILRSGEVAMLTGRVLDGGSSRPVPSFVVVAMKDGQTLTSANVVDPAGEFALAGLPAGEVTLVATATGHAVSRETPAQVGGPPVEIRLSRGGRVEGTVIDAASRKPLPLARVSLELDLGTAPVSASTVTDDHGRFSLDGVGAGARSIIAAAFAHHMKLVSGLSVDDGGTVGPITIELPPTADGEQPRLELFGIGVKVSLDGDALRIDGVIAGGGAAEKGLAIGDRIQRVDGTAVRELGLAGSLERIRGSEGTEVELEIRRGDRTSSVSVPRRRIRA